MADRILTVDQLINELKNYNHKELHAHHTWRPDHSNWRQRPNAQHWQNSMRNYHVNNLGWQDIGQHVTLMPDGNFVTGRSFGTQPASIKGYNRVKGGVPFMVEMLGNFDIGHDKFEGTQKKSMLKLAKWFYDRGKYIRFHRENASKTCPGTDIDKTQFMREVRGQTSSVSSGSGNNTSTVLRRGSKGTQVRHLQMNLSGLGYKGVSIDGILGKNTFFKIEESIKNKDSNNNKLYRVQVGAFGVRDNAQKLVDKLKAKGYDAIIVQDGGLYKVQTGAFSKRENADNLVAQLKRDGYEALVV